MGTEQINKSFCIKHTIDSKYVRIIHMIILTNPFYKLLAKIIRLLFPASIVNSTVMITKFNKTDITDQIRATNDCVLYIQDNDSLSIYQTPLDFPRFGFYACPAFS